MNKLTSEHIREICNYCPDTGMFVRTKKKSWCGNLYDCYFVPKSKTAYGYLQMNIGGRPHMVHRLIFLWMTGDFPSCDVDHINGDRSDNRWVNLRVVSREDNLRNQGIRVDNTSGQCGVSFDKSKGKYFAYIGIGKGKRQSLGYYDDFATARDVRLKAEQELNYHQNHGKRESWSE